MLKLSSIEITIHESKSWRTWRSRCICHGQGSHGHSLLLFSIPYNQRVPLVFRTFTMFTSSRRILPNHFHAPYHDARLRSEFSVNVNVAFDKIKKRKRIIQRTSIEREKEKERGRKREGERDGKERFLIDITFMSWFFP